EEFLRRREAGEQPLEVARARDPLAELVRQLALSRSRRADEQHVLPRHHRAEQPFDDGISLEETRGELFLKRGQGRRSGAHGYSQNAAGRPSNSRLEARSASHPLCLCPLGRAEGRVRGMTKTALALAALLVPALAFADEPSAQ